MKKLSFVTSTELYLSHLMNQQRLIDQQRTLCSCSVASDSLWPYELQPARLLRSWDSPGKNSGVGCHVLLQGIFSIQGLNQHLLHWQADSLPPSHQGSPIEPCVCVCVCVCVLAAQLCPTLCHPTDCSLPGSSVLGCLQARILGWVAMPFSSGSSRPRDWTQVSCAAGGSFTFWASRELCSYKSGMKFASIFNISHPWA